MSSAEFLQEVEEQRPERVRAGVKELAEKTRVSPGGSEAVAEDRRAHEVIKLRVDVHLDRYVVVRQIDGGAPQPPQRFSPDQFVQWAKKQTELAKRVDSCHEAGPFGYSLHRKLIGLGLTNYVLIIDLVSPE